MLGRNEVAHIYKYTSYVIRWVYENLIPSMCLVK